MYQEIKILFQSKLEKEFVKKMHKDERKLLRKDPDLYKEVFNQNWYFLLALCFSCFHYQVN